MDRPTRTALRRETLRCASPDTLHDLRFVGAGVTLNYGSVPFRPIFAAAAAVLLAAAVAHADTETTSFSGCCRTTD